MPTIRETRRQELIRAIEHLVEEADEAGRGVGSSFSVQDAWHEVESCMDRFEDVVADDAFDSGYADGQSDEVNGHHQESPK